MAMRRRRDRRHNGGFGVESRESPRNLRDPWEQIGDPDGGSSKHHSNSDRVYSDGEVGNVEGISGYRRDRRRTKC